MADLSLSNDSAYGSNSWASARLGKSVDWFYRNREKLVTEGFPASDPLTNSYIKADVDAWITKRRRISDMIENASSSILKGVNFDGI